MQENLLVVSHHRFHSSNSNRSGSCGPTGAQLRVILTTSELIADIMYVPALCILNLFLLVSSTACLYLGSIMINIYLLPYLDLMNAHFATVPYLILAIGGLLLLVSIFGIAAAAAKSRVLLLIYSIVLGLAFVLQLASIFTSMELRNELQLKLMFVKVCEKFRH